MRFLIIMLFLVSCSSVEKPRSIASAEKAETAAEASERLRVATGLTIEETIELHQLEKEFGASVVASGYTSLDKLPTKIIHECWPGVPVLTHIKEGAKTDTVYGTRVINVYDVNFKVFAVAYWCKQ